MRLTRPESGQEGPMGKEREGVTQQPRLAGPNQPESPSHPTPDFGEKFRQHPGPWLGSFCVECFGCCPSSQGSEFSQGLKEELPIGPQSCSLPGECCAGRVSILRAQGHQGLLRAPQRPCLSPATPAHGHSECDFLLLARVGWESRDVNQAGQDS